MTKSTHRVEVFRVEDIEPHPNADRLEIVSVWGYKCVVLKGQFKNGDLAAYIPPDSVVPETDQFEFLWKGHKGDSEKHRRVRAVRLRGILSPGLIVEAPQRSEEGDDVAESLGVTHWEPQENTGGEAVAGPPIPMTNTAYDLENGYRYHHVIPEGTDVVITEKIHGASSRFVCWDGQLYAGSRNQWKSDHSNAMWWKILNQAPGIQSFCRNYPGFIIYGEAYGMVQSLRYGHTGEKPFSFAGFDIFSYDKLAFLHHNELQSTLRSHGIPTVPILATGPYSMEFVEKHVSGPSVIAEVDHEREGIVVTPMDEFPWDPEIGRVKLKFVSSEHLSRN
jgi:RNA ligase (TIGR02306 family)